MQAEGTSIHRVQGLVSPLQILRNMLKYLFSILILAGLLVIFSIQNTGSLTMHVLLWQVNISLTLLIAVLVVLGAILGVLLTVIPVKRRKKLKNHSS